MTEAEWLNPQKRASTKAKQFVDVVPSAVYRRHRQPCEFRGMAFERGYVGVWRQIRFRRRTSNFYNEISDTDWRKRAFVGPDAKYADYSDITN